MAKKNTKKAVKKAAGKPAKKSSKPVKAGKPAKSAKGAGAAKVGVFPVSTGSGATPVQVGKTLVAMFNEGKLREIEDMYWAPDIVSVEGMGVAMEWRGRAAVTEKNHGWLKENRIVSAKAMGPFVGASGFAVHFTMEIEKIADGSKTSMEEVGVYTVRDGKICREEFMYKA